VYQKAPGLPAQERERYLYGMDMIGVMQMDISGQPPELEQPCEECPPPPPPLSIGLGCNGQRMYYLKDQVGNVRVILLRGTTAGTPPLAFQNYYPFGMKQPGGLSSSHTQRFGYQGEYAEQDPETKLAAFEARMYDAVTGRWLAVDPQHQYHSPYLAMGNNPVMMVDPDGEFVVLIAMGVGALVGYTSGRQAGLRGSDLLSSTIAGGVIGGLSAGVGSAVGVAVAGAFSAGASTIAVGAVSGAAGGFAGGFVGGFASAAFSGSGNPLEAGLKAGAIGGITGGVFGALGGGFQNLNDGKNFWGNRYRPTGLAYEYTVDVSGKIRQISDLGGSDTHFYHFGRYVDNQTGFISNLTKVIDGANSINAFRFWQSASSTISAFSAPGAGLTGYFMEPKGPSPASGVRYNTRLPEGSYSLQPHSGERYKDVYRLMNDNLRGKNPYLIHRGAIPQDTRGCLLPGCDWVPDKMLKSSIKLEAINAYIRSVRNKVTVNIYDTF
jgi:RHS repeat-associated protein